MTMATITLRCPQCQHFLGEIAGFARLVCPDCGTEVTVRSKQARGQDRERAVLTPPETRATARST